jgi:hypothetical protein
VAHIESKNVGALLDHLRQDLLFGRGRPERADDLGLAHV